MLFIVAYRKRSFLANDPEHQFRRPTNDAPGDSSVTRLCSRTSHSDVVVVIEDGGDDVHPTC
jgi:hypothetical protein